jgi:hypothetical protein
MPRAHLAPTGTERAEDVAPRRSLVCTSLDDALLSARCNRSRPSDFLCRTVPGRALCELARECHAKARVEPLGGVRKSGPAIIVFPADPRPIVADM